jgi:hypothetical protein
MHIRAITAIIKKEWHIKSKKSNDGGPLQFDKEIRGDFLEYASCTLFLGKLLEDGYFFTDGISFCGVFVRFSAREVEFKTTIETLLKNSMSGKKIRRAEGGGGVVPGRFFSVFFCRFSFCRVSACGAQKHHQNISKIKPENIQNKKAGSALGTSLPPPPPSAPCDETTPLPTLAGQVLPVPGARPELARSTRSWRQLWPCERIRRKSHRGRGGVVAPAAGRCGPANAHSGDHGNKPKKRRAVDEKQK